MTPHLIALTTAALAQSALPALPGGRANGRSAGALADPATVVLDASRFLDEIQRGHIIVDAASLRVPWLFNNTAASR